MSFSDALGQVAQIMQWEQQLGQVGSGAGTTGTAAAPAAGTAAQGTAGTSAEASFAQALAAAQTQDGTAAAVTDPSASPAGASLAGASPAGSLLSGGDGQLLAALSSYAPSNGTTTPAGLTTTPAGLTTTPAGLANAAGPAAGTATSAEDPRIQAMTQEANALLGEPYVYGGGHDGWGPQSGYDCSGFVSAVLHAGGYLSTPRDTTSLPNAPGLASGPGQYVTIYDRDASGEAGHVIISIDGQFYESGGERGTWGGGGGVEKIATPSAAYLSSFNVVLHPVGL